MERSRELLLRGLPVTERRLQIAGVSTAVLEGGSGHPVIMLHGPGEFGGKWRRIIPQLVTTHRVVAPDLPGHGESSLVDGHLDADGMRAWMSGLIERTCASKPVLVGHVLGGALAGIVAVALGPVAVTPRRQRSGLGTSVVRDALRRATEARERMVLVLGEPAYYQRFGFVPAAPYGVTSEWSSAGDAWQLLALRPVEARYPSPWRAV